MSTATQQPEQAQLPNVETAYGNIIEGVHKQAFLARLQQHGYVAETPAEADELVELGFKLANADEGDGDGGVFAGNAKTAAPGRFAAASQALDRHLGVSSTDSEIKQAAFALAHDPQIYGSALVLKHAQAQALAAPAEGEQAA